MSAVRRHTSSRALGICLLVVGLLTIGCGGASSTARPSASLVTLDFTPLPTVTPGSASATRTARPSTLPASWPVGWDVSFCTAFADLTVAHELVIDIERAIADDNSKDAQGLADELAQTAQVATGEVSKMKDWEQAAEAKTTLANLLSLDEQAATAYRSYFNDDVKSGLRQARQARNQVSKAVGPANEQLQQLAAIGVSCPGTDLKLESF